MLQRGKDAHCSHHRWRWCPWCPHSPRHPSGGAKQCAATKLSKRTNSKKYVTGFKQISIKSNMYSIMFSRWVDGWMDCWQIVKFGLQVFLQWLWSYHVPTTFVSWHCSTYCKWFRDQGGRFVWGATDAARAICFPFEFQGLSLAHQYMRRIISEKATKWVVENAWLCTCFPVWIFHIQCRSFVVLLVIIA